TSPSTPDSILTRILNGSSQESLDRSNPFETFSLSDEEEDLETSLNKFMEMVDERLNETELESPVKQYFSQGDVDEEAFLTKQTHTKKIQVVFNNGPVNEKFQQNTLRRLCGNKFMDIEICYVDISGILALQSKPDEF